MWLRHDAIKYHQHATRYMYAADIVAGFVYMYFTVFALFGS